MFCKLCSQDETINGNQEDVVDMFEGSPFILCRIGKHFRDYIESFTMFECYFFVKNRLERFVWLPRFYEYSTKLVRGTSSEILLNQELDTITTTKMVLIFKKEKDILKTNVWRSSNKQFPSETCIPLIRCFLTYLHIQTHTQDYNNIALMLQNCIYFLYPK